MPKQFCLTLDLKDDPQLIQAYEEHHRKVWPEILKSIKDAGILEMQIYRWSNRLFMVMKTGDDFSFKKKSQMDSNNAKVQEWEELMWEYQQALPGAKEGEKWQLMDKIFEL